MFSTVTQKVKETKQPRGGYVNPKNFEVVCRKDDYVLSEKENIHPALVGLAVDYLTRYMMGAAVDEAFEISLMGASTAGKIRQAQNIIKKINGLDDESIFNACKMVGYDVCYRAGMEYFKPVNEIRADQPTIENIRIMVKRAFSFWEEYGPLVLQGLAFEKAYTFEIIAGDADYLTEDTLWDFKVSKKKPNKDHTLQLLIYYIMGCHSIHEKEFKKVKKIGIFNPRLNIVYYMNISKIDKDIIKEISENIIGY